jgi:glycosyltransferase involved in cell wall biosynthesis
MKKNILIDATTVTSQVDGLSHCIINLIKYLPAQSFNKFNYTVLINKGVKRKLLTELLYGTQINVLEAKIAPIGPKRDWDMFWFLLKHKKKFDLIHITSNNYPLALKNGVSTIHDITFKKYFDNPKYTFNLAQVYLDIVIKNALKKAQQITAVSQATKNDLINTYKLSEAASSKIKVVHLGWEHLIHEDDREIIPSNTKLHADKDYLLYVGTFRVHKNISNLLLAFKTAIKKLPPQKKLIIIGNNKHLKQEDLKIISEINEKEIRVIFTGYLSQSLLSYYFKNADAYIFPSLSEGFGLGVLEAFYYNVPLLCSNTTSLPEIAGNAALYFNPSNPLEIAEAIIKFYSNPLLASILVEEGKERLKQFSWKKNAAETVKVYESCLGI